MTNAKHTPGPWNANKASSAGYDIICSDVAPVDVCVISKRDKTQEEINANARLIAAAPELLDALETLAEHFEYYMGDNECRPIENARAAIAKARGGAA